MKENAIEIVKNLSMTIKKLRKVQARVSKPNNEVFKNPSASVEQLERRRKQIITKYKLKKTDDEFTYS